MSLKRKAEDFCRRAGFPLAKGVRVLCAVSGGLDSMVLLHLLWTQSQNGRFSVSVATFDHRLRPESGADTAFVSSWCSAREIPCCVGAGDVAAFSRARGQTVEEAARNLRYEFLERAAEEAGADYIATAHTADDNAETVLLHLLRGSGLNGLGGIPPRRGRIIRPLLEITRCEIETYAGEKPQPCQNPRLDGREPAPGRGVPDAADGGDGKALADGGTKRCLCPGDGPECPAQGHCPPTGAENGGTGAAGDGVAPQSAAGAAGIGGKGAPLRDDFSGQPITGTAQL